MCPQDHRNGCHWAWVCENTVVILVGVIWLLLLYDDQSAARPYSADCYASFAKLLERLGCAQHRHSFQTTR